MNGFPVLSLSDGENNRAHREGMPLVSQYGQKLGVVTTAQSLAFLQPTPTSLWRVKQIIVSANEACIVNVQIIAPAYTVSVGGYIPIAFGSATGGTVTLPVSLTLHENQSISATVESASGTTANFKSYIGIFGDQLSVDVAYEAPRQLLIVGDSIGAGTGVTVGENHYSFLIRDWLIGQTGKLWRQIRKAQGSFTSAHIESMRAAGYLNVPAPDLILFAMGMNDTSSTIYDANLAKFLTWVTLRYPKAVVVVCGPTLRTDAQETVLAAIRAAASTRVAALGNSNVVYLNMGDLWVSGSHSAKTTDLVHPNNSGHIDMSNALKVLLAASSNVLLNKIK